MLLYILSNLTYQELVSRICILDKINGLYHQLFGLLINLFQLCHNRLHLIFLSLLIFLIFNTPTYFH